MLQLLEYSKKDIEYYISQYQDFTLYGVKDMSDYVRAIEDIIESKGMRCRVYTIGRAAGVAAALVNPIAFLGAAGAMIAHNAVTFNPDWEIGRNFVNNRIEVKCKRREKLQKR